MGRWKTAASVAAFVAVAGVGTVRNPVLHGQVPVRIQAPAARVFELAGSGSWIGVSVRELADEDVTKAKLPNAGGVLVEDVSSDSPAATAGLKPGDVIVEFDGERVRSTRQFARLVQETPTGRRVQASVLRQGQRVPLSIEPRAATGGSFSYDFNMPEIARGWGMPPAPPAPPARPVPPGAPAPPAPPAPPAMRGFFDFDELIGRGAGRLGVTVSGLEPQLAEYFAVKEGALVTSVTSGSAAEKAGVKAGDVITTLNGSPIASPTELRQKSSRLDDGAELTLGVVRDRKPATLKGKVEGSSQRRRTATVL